MPRATSTYHQASLQNLSYNGVTTLISTIKKNSFDGVFNVSSLQSGATFIIVKIYK